MDPLLPGGLRAFCGCSGRLPPSVHHCESGSTLGLVTVRKPPQTPVQPAYAALLSLSPPSLCPLSTPEQTETARFRQYSLTDPNPLGKARNSSLRPPHNPPPDSSARLSPPQKTNRQSKSTIPSKCLLVPASSSKWLSMSTQVSNQPIATKARGSFLSVPSFSAFHSAQLRLRPYRISSDQQLLRDTPF